MVKGDLAIQFVPQQLTSYSGLELLRRYGQRLGLAARLRAAFAGLRSDYGNTRVGLLLLALFFVGGRRLEHLRHVADDPLITRFCGLARLPTGRTVANCLKQFTQETLAPLVALVHTARLPRTTLAFQSRLRVIATAQDPAVVRTILAHVGRARSTEAPDPAPPAPAAIG